jgi:UDP-N-acetylmuramoylalanine--D-glutamate ligase
MELKGKRVLVIGLGESGLAMAKWLHRQGAFVRVADSRDTPPNSDALQRVAPGAELQAGEFTVATFAGMDIVALSPGVPKATPAIAAATETKAGARGDLPLISEIELFAAGVRDQVPGSKILAITGSNGKTTTTALTAHLLNAAGVPAVACGNISPSALDALMDAQDAGTLPAIWVLELSSFQLETTHHLNAVAATVLNLSEDHLDRYDGSLANYAAAKSRVFQGKGSMILNRDDDWSMGNGRCGRKMITFGLNPASRAVDYGYAEGAIWRGKERIVAVDELKLAGLHNAANAMAALALCETVGVEPRRLVEPLKAFAGLPHRVEKVAEIGGVTYIDDSKGTNVGATLAAIEGMGRKVAIVLGGDGKGQDFSPLQPALEKHGRAVALIGRDAEAIAAAIAGYAIPVQQVADMAAAVSWLSTQVRAGDCVLLSPACASLDMYRNYAHRAQAFIDAVKGLSA